MITWRKILEFTNNGNPKPPRRVEKSDKEWQKILNREEYRIMRNHGTETAFKGEFCESFDPGTYECRCCGTRLFDAEEKYDSRSGWPSFTQPVEENVIKYSIDRTLGMTRVEIQCNVCDAHLGHVFPDGPKPGKLRYCVNSVSLKKK